MAEGADDSQKTEDPSARKLARARDRGQVAQSREINTWFMLATGAGIVLVLAPPMARNLARVLAGFVDVTRFLGPDGGIRWDAIEANLGEIASSMLLPLALAMAAAVAGSIVQTGLVFAVEKLGLDFSRLSPLAGFGRLFAARNLIEFAKNIGKIAVVAAIAGWIMLPELDRLALLPSVGAEGIMREIEHVVLRLILGVLAALTLVAIGDYVWQRFAFLRSMRMSKQELKEEHKQAEGDPTVRARLRQIRMERARRRMMAAVPGASVVITNPTHYAVALQYEMGEKAAPRVVAKGADLIALRIREIAKEHDVPVVENPPLARALYAGVELDREIPPEHYRAVAEIIGYVFRLKGKMKPAASQPGATVLR